MGESELFKDLCLNSGSVVCKSLGKFILQSLNKRKETDVLLSLLYY